MTCGGGSICSASCRPLQPVEALLTAGRLKAGGVAGTDVLIVRENVGGEYQGEWRETADAREGRVCEHSFRYSEPQVRRLLEVAAKLASHRRGRLTVVVKDGGIPSVSALWRHVGREAAAAGAGRGRLHGHRPRGVSASSRSRSPST